MLRIPKKTAVPVILNLHGRDCTNSGAGAVGRRRWRRMPWVEKKAQARKRTKSRRDPNQLDRFLLSTFIVIVMVDCHFYCPQQKQERRTAC